MNIQKKLVICGAGGHANSVLDIALQNNEYDIIGCTDLEYPKKKVIQLRPDISIIGSDDSLKYLFKEGVRHIFVAIGNNQLRKKIYESALNIGYEPVNIISQHSIISSRAHLGIGICVMPGAVINVNTFIGDNSIINTRCSVDHDCNIGKHCHIAPGATTSGFVSIGEGTHIGTGSSIIDKINIGDWSYIGAGSVVIKDIDKSMMVYGVPAREIRKL